jgi:hypothetical protein
MERFEKNPEFIYLPGDVAMSEKVRREHSLYRNQRLPKHSYSDGDGDGKGEGNEYEDEEGDDGGGSSELSDNILFVIKKLEREKEEAEREKERVKRLKAIKGEEKNNVTVGDAANNEYRTTRKQGPGTYHDGDGGGDGAIDHSQHLYPLERLFHEARSKASKHSQRKARELTNTTNNTNKPHRKETETKAEAEAETETEIKTGPLERLMRRYKKSANNSEQVQ